MINGPTPYLVALLAIGYTYGLRHHRHDSIPAHGEVCTWIPLLPVGHRLCPPAFFGPAGTSRC